MQSGISEGEGGVRSLACSLARSLVPSSFNRLSARAANIEFSITAHIHIAPAFCPLQTNVGSIEKRLRTAGRIRLDTVETVVNLKLRIETHRIVSGERNRFFFFSYGKQRRTSELTNLLDEKHRPMVIPYGWSLKVLSGRTCSARRCHQRHLL